MKVKHARHFLHLVLGMIRKALPEFYEQHIRRKHLQIIADVTPDKNFVGKRLGYVSKDLRLLRGLGKVLDEAGYNETLPYSDGDHHVITACRALGGITQQSIGSLCRTAFWTMVQKRFNPRSNHRLLGINHDWSVVTISGDKASEEQASTILGDLLELMERQAEATEGAAKIGMALKEYRQSLG